MGAVSLPGTAFCTRVSPSVCCAEERVQQLIPFQSAASFWDVAGWERNKKERTKEFCFFLDPGQQARKGRHFSLRNPDICCLLCEGKERRGLSRAGAVHAGHWGAPTPPPPPPLTNWKERPRA